MSEDFTKADNATSPAASIANGNAKHLNASAEENPIYDRWFANAAFFTSKVFDSPVSISFRKHLTMWRLLSDSKPSSQPTADLVERIGDRAIHHVIWLEEEGIAGRNSISWQEGKRGAKRVMAAETQIRRYLTEVYRTMATLRSRFR